ncbi:MAG: hypothetical protein M5T61_21625 [Acidimicrobiia bacterium]|nr:hypothetical protein [Acidimicrobiia bacterium]
MSALHDQELADVIEAERIRTEAEAWPIDLRPDPRGDRTEAGIRRACPLRLLRQPCPRPRLPRPRRPPRKRRVVSILEISADGYHADQVADVPSLSRSIAHILARRRRSTPGTRTRS